MPDAAIRFDQISKKYRLRHGWYFSIRDEVARLFGRMVGGGPAEASVFWALKDVSFDVARGETLGLIGPNGAGKSTILKILSRITVPTSGAFAVSGSVGALIEVGAGFHPDLTGRENVYLSGAIRGMRRAEIEAKFDRIVAFAEVKRFIDTPIKYYSSGMLVRLGFAVAAHIDPEILLVDEVLAVGDAAFQAKCLNKIAELKEQDKTIILVSHNMGNIVHHCTRVLWIDNGTVRACGEPERIVDEYLSTVPLETAGPLGAEAVTDGPIRIGSVRVLDARGAVADALEYGQPATVEIGYEILGPIVDPVVSVSFHDARGFRISGLTTRLDGLKLDTTGPAGAVQLTLAPVIFTRGAYSISVAIHDEHIQRYWDLRTGATTFTVEGPSVASREVRGFVVLPHRWDAETREP